MQGRVTRLVSAGDDLVRVRVASPGTEPLVLFPSIGEYGVYDDTAYDGFAAADQRNRAYRGAIAEASPGRAVLDLGTGRDALWAVTAARAGARRVYAVEARPDVAAQARRAVDHAGVASVVSVIDGHSTVVSLPERVEVCVSELVGNIASAEGMLPVLADARRRLCAPGCVFIPHSCRTRAMAVDLDSAVGPGGPVIAEEALSYLQVVFADLGRPFDLRLCLGGPVGEVAASSVGTVETISQQSYLSTGDAVDRCATETSLTITGAGVTGIVFWVEVLCAPGQPALDALSPDGRSWAPVYAPIAPACTLLRPGDQLDLTFVRTTSRDGHHPDYSLTVHARGQGSGQSHLVGEWNSLYRDQGFRDSDFYRELFPG